MSGFEVTLGGQPLPGVVSLSYAFAGAADPGSGALALRSGWSYRPCGCCGTLYRDGEAIAATGITGGHTRGELRSARRRRAAARQARLRALQLSVRTPQRGGPLRPRGEPYGAYAVPGTGVTLRFGEGTVCA